MTRKNRGFSLIELLVVVAIIALLIAILVPSLSRARDQAKTAGCLSNLRQVGVGVEMYVTDATHTRRVDLLPVGRYRGGPLDGHNYASILIEFGYLATPADINRTVFRCPSGLDRPGDMTEPMINDAFRSKAFPYYQGFNGYWENTVTASGKSYRTWYGYNGGNARDSAMPWWGPSAGNWGGDTQPVRRTPLKRPQDLVLIYDGLTSQFSGSAIPFSARHNGGTMTNLLMADGSVQTLRASTMWQGKFTDLTATTDTYPKWRVLQVTN